MNRTFKSLPIEQLKRGQYQPRQTFAKEGLEELAKSILTQGLIEPLIVRPLFTNTYEIIAGERRFRAAILAGLKEVPCLICDYTDKDAAAITLIENIQRADLNVIEEASGYQRLQNEFNFSQDDIATLVGKSRSHITNIIRTLSLCTAVQNALKEQKIGLGHAKMLVGLPDYQQIELLAQIHTEDLSVRRLEEVVRNLKQTSTTKVLAIDNDKQRLETELAEQIGAPVEILTTTQGGGILKIKYFDNDMLSGLLERMGLSYDG